MRPALPTLILFAISCTNAAPPSAYPTPPAPEEPSRPGERAGGARKIVLTIDDLPVADFGRRDKRERLEVVQALTGALTKAQVPFVAFYNLSQNDKDSRLLPFWLKTPGGTPGNHTWSHPHPTKVGTKAYLQDLERGDRAVRKLPGATATLPFRHPYLQEGFPCEQRADIQAKISALGEEQVPVTIDTWDWYYARRYEAALRAKDSARAEILSRSFLAHVEGAVVEAEVTSRHLFGREPAQVMLLHGNRLLADHLPDLLALLKRRGYEVIPWSQARKDPAYAEVDRSISPSGTTRWRRLLRSRAAPEVCQGLTGSKATP